MTDCLIKVQTFFVNMSAEPVAMTPGQLVRRSRTGMHTGRMKLMPADPVHYYPTFLLVGFNYNIHYCWCDVTNMHDCWPGVSINGMYAGSVPHYLTHVMLRLSDMMSLWHYMAATQ